MLSKLTLTNFRCFANHEIKFQNFNVIVGKNNVGKSTVIDALKLVANVCRYASHRTTNLEQRDIPFSQVNLRHDYTERDTIIRAEFSNHMSVEILFPVDDRPRMQFFENDIPVGNKSTSVRQLRQSMGVIPPVGAFDEDEGPVTSEHLASIMSSHLMPRHFRAVWKLFPEGFQEFQQLLATSWPECAIQPPEFHMDSQKYTMMFTENRIPREIFWAGHGFQVWLQLLTYLVKLGEVETLILDEPDIYLHSDMQKRLIAVCRGRSNQTIIATHAVDIIEEAQPDDITSVDKNLAVSRRLTTIDEVQAIISQLGSQENLRLVHFIRGKTVLFVEGTDFKYLKVIAGKLGFQQFAQEHGFTVVSLEGFSSWEKLAHINWIFENVLGEKIKCYMILDRDYHSQEEIQRITELMLKKGVRLHIWSKKELENYAINLAALYRSFSAKFSERYNRNPPIPENIFHDNVLSLIEQLRDDVLSQRIASATHAKSDRSIDDVTITRRVIRGFDQDWRDTNFRLSVIPGKEFFSKLNTWLNGQYHISIPISSAFFSLRADEIAPELGESISEFLAILKP